MCLFDIVNADMVRNYRDWDAKHNICAFLDLNSTYSVNFIEMITFLRRSRIFTAITMRTTPYQSIIQSFWDNAEVDCDVDPPVIRSKVKGRPAVISEDDIRNLLQFGDQPNQPFMLDDRLVRGCFQRMRYQGDINQKQYIRAKLSVQWKYLLHVLVHCLGSKKGGYDLCQEELMSAAVALTLNIPFNFSGMIFSYMKSNLSRTDKNFKKFWMYPRFIQALIDIQLPDLEKLPKDIMVLEHMDRLTLNRLNIYRGISKSERPPYKGPFGHIRNENYIAPANNQWRHDDSDSGSENMEKYLGQRELDAEGNPLPRRRRRRQRAEHAHEPELEPILESEESESESESLESEPSVQEGSSKRPGKQVVDESSESESSDSDAPPNFAKYGVWTDGKLNLTKEQLVQAEEGERDPDHYETITRKLSMGTVTYRQRKKVSEIQKDKDFDPRSEKSKQKKGGRVKHMSKRPRETKRPTPQKAPAKKKQKTTPVTEPGEHVFDKNAPGLEDIFLNIDEALRTPPEHRSSEQQQPPQDTEDETLKSVLLKYYELKAVVDIQAAVNRSLAAEVRELKAGYGQRIVQL